MRGGGKKCLPSLFNSAYTVHQASTLCQAYVVWQTVLLVLESFVRCTFGEFHWCHHLVQVQLITAGYSEHAVSAAYILTRRRKWFRFKCMVSADHWNLCGAFVYWIHRSVYLINCIRTPRCSWKCGFLRYTHSPHGHTDHYTAVK